MQRHDQAAWPDRGQKAHVNEQIEEELTPNASKGGEPLPESPSPSMYNEYVVYSVDIMCHLTINDDPIMEI